MLKMLRRGLWSELLSMFQEFSYRAKMSTPANPGISHSQDRLSTPDSDTSDCHLTDKRGARYLIQFGIRPVCGYMT